ncbi:polyketide synthase [Leptolyngbyaceae cyanobacterium CCMR0082]|uniref:Polyketide synthase n=1 Tax=Adonisia turfae CCMR0082 TaxID=2304604 RepID=A0A6M0S703_9CYAN|nr:type I polyketide synthase [Adonisia turfae]NEZ63612.1 polyketide synthase [Adonisia turfae CCMR0082]
MTSNLEKKAKNQPIAVVGIGCYYPGANTVRGLWENILSRRRQFRKFPDVRLPMSEYYHPDKKAPDKTYGSQAAFIDGFEFDWSKRRIPKKTYDTTDIVHWISLEVAIKTLEDANYSRDNVPTNKTGVILGNTLTGEQVRSQSLRLRWPYVRKALRAAAKRNQLGEGTTEELVMTMEKYYKSVFASINEDTLAGNLSNTIAGRLCNFFDFHGGGYVVDGACSSSLIAISTACEKLATGDLNMALAGGVDISLDTFELIGFAKVGALSASDMKVYDNRASGFIPGEGCGFVTLKRLEDARKTGDYVYGVIQGWGISSDGKGGITAPTSIGQSKALGRAYEKASYSIHELDFVEGHGTGTPIGDRIELEGISIAIANEGELPARSVGVTSFKSLVGHTKAAAGVGGFIKALVAVNQRVIPPTAGCQELNSVFDTNAKSLYPVLTGEIRPATDTLRAGVSAMGFGGINSHITLESGDAPAEKLKSSLDTRALLVSNQETELFVFSSDSLKSLINKIESWVSVVEEISLAEMADFAVELTQQVQGSHQHRAATIADTPKNLVQKLIDLKELLQNTPPASGEVIATATQDGWVSNHVNKHRVGFLFPGQGSQKLNATHVLIERYGWARDFLKQADGWLIEMGFTSISNYLYPMVEKANDSKQLDDWKKTISRADIASPIVCFCSLLWQRYLSRLGIKPSLVAGHSLGELTAFYSASAFDEKTLICLAALRGKGMLSKNDILSGMLSLGCDKNKADELLKGISGYILVANINSPTQTVVSGDLTSIEQLMAKAQHQNIQTHQLQVSNAFHSERMSEAAEFLKQHAQLPDILTSPSLSIFSSMDGKEVRGDIDLKEHFAKQVVSPVDFVSLVESVFDKCDFLVEVGSGRVLSGLVNATVDPQKLSCFPTESKARNDKDLNTVLANYYIRGGLVNWEELYQNRLIHPFVVPATKNFIENQCEKPFAVSEADLVPLSTNGKTSESDLDIVETLADYFDQRGAFLAEIIQADLETLPLLPVK